MVRNEEKWLERCLMSLEPLRKAVRSELIIVDTGSEDRTLEIARQYTKRVYSHPWNNDFAAMRNIVLGYARGEWFFSLDADEILENAEPIIDFLSSPNRKKFRTAQVFVKNVLRETPEIISATIALPRLFRNESGFRYVGSIHEQPTFRTPVIQLPATLVHYGYLATDQELMERKFQRNAPMLEAALEKDPDNVYYWYQLFQTYGMHKDRRKALDAIIRAYELVRQSGMPWDRFMYVLIGRIRAHHVLRQHRQVIQIAEEAKKVRDDYPDVFYYKAFAHAETGEHEAAIEEYERYLEIALNFKRYKSYTDSSVTHYSLHNIEHARAELIRLYHVLGQHEEVIRRVADVDKVALLEPAMEKVIDSFFRVADYRGLYRFYEKLESVGEQRVLQKFLFWLEQSRLEAVTDVDRELSIVFSRGDSEYALLNHVRLLQSCEDLKNLSSRIQRLEWKVLPTFYGELLYLSLRNGLVKLASLSNVEEKRLSGFLTFAQKRHPDLPVILSEWLMNLEMPDAVADLRVAKILARYVLLHHDWDNDHFKSLFDRYVIWGVGHILSLYNKNVLENEVTSELRTEEEIALLYLWKSSSKAADPRRQVEYLRKAVNTFPPLARGIKMRLEDFQTKWDISEYEEHRKKVKQNIRFLVESGSFQEAEMLLQEYANLVLGDPDVYAFRSTIAAAQGRISEAEQWVNEGLELFPCEFDLNFNRAYISFLLGNFAEALDQCERAKQFATKQEHFVDLEALIQEIRIAKIRS